MSTDGILVNHGALEQATADMQQSIKDIDDRLNRLEAELKPLQSDWHGQAQESYRISKGKWDQAIADMRNLLNETQMGVSNSNSEYAAADRRGAGHFEGL
ncbi:WXG100 family type VII secretion target [Nocardioides sp. R-C-SC26]|uniref:WXG100 family type VII secretion target n=1 Tax=Nocardioides sp. R-C-SC26 TaxID=2870414 RepID=UPI001E390499|nr:WXG100 family type VII secretion target [Nocardioides sp. R-C-SC26]